MKETCVGVCSRGKCACVESEGLSGGYCLVEDSVAYRDGECFEAFGHWYRYCVAAECVREQSIVCDGYLCSFLDL